MPVGSFPTNLSAFIGVDNRLMCLLGRAHYALGFSERDNLLAAKQALQEGDYLDSSQAIAIASLSLDASAINKDIACLVDDGEMPALADDGTLDGSVIGGWAEAFGLGDNKQAKAISAYEYESFLTAIQALPSLSKGFKKDPIGGFSLLHRMVSSSLVKEGTAGTYREEDHVVNDGFSGKMLYEAAKPADIQTLLEQLEGWIKTKSWFIDPLIVSGVIHWFLLTVMPFSSANGRTARLAVRLYLYQKYGSLLDQLNMEYFWNLDRLSYYETAGKELVRNNLTLFLTQHVWAITQAAEHLLYSNEIEEKDNERADHAISTYSPKQVFSIKDYSELTNSPNQVASSDLAYLQRKRKVIDLPDGLHYMAYPYI